MTDVSRPVAVRHGSRISMRFTLSLGDGTPVEQSGDEPMQFSIGAGDLHPGLEACLMGMMPGDGGTFHIAPGGAFGEPDPANVQMMPRTDFGVDMEPVEGQVIGFDTPNGEQLAGTVMEVADGVVVVDFNHPLAGREVVFQVEILEVD